MMSMAWENMYNVFESSRVSASIFVAKGPEFVDQKHLQQRSAPNPKAPSQGRYT